MHYTPNNKPPHQQVIRFCNDPDGTPIVKVRVIGSRHPAVLLAEDFQHIPRSIHDQRWRTAYHGASKGAVYFRHIKITEPRKRGAKETIIDTTISVARLVSGAKRGMTVRYLDGDPLNLRRDNLRIERGYSKIEANTHPAEDASR